MLIKSKLTKQDFVKLNFYLLYGKISMKLFTIMTVLLFLITITISLFSKNDFSLTIVLFIAFLLFMPLMTYIGAVINFNPNNRASETIEYHFTNEYLSIKGESFNSQLSWEKINKVTQSKNWILIWQNKLVGNPIVKRNISQEQIKELKEILDNVKVKNNL